MELENDQFSFKTFKILFCEASKFTYEVILAVTPTHNGLPEAETGNIQMLPTLASSTSSKMWLIGVLISFLRLS